MWETVAGMTSFASWAVSRRRAVAGAGHESEHDTVLATGHWKSPPRDIEELLVGADFAARDQP